MAKKKYLEESERKLIESVNNAYIPTDWDEFEKRYHEMERYGDGKPRKVDKEKMEYIEDGLVSRGIGGNQLSSLLSTIVEESGGNPFSVDDSRKFRGLIQFSKERYPEKDFDRDKKAGWKKAVDNQLDVIVDHLNEYGGDYGFLDGGDGSGYMTGEEAKDAFWDRDSDIENVTRALTYGFVRPGDRSGTTENRTRVARLINEIIQPPVEAPDILEFDYDGKHYKATKPEEVTPEMRRALMLSKLVGEKNKVELQDPLYTTFDEAYGRAKGKGARVFMWNGKKYSTKEEGGEVKDMEKFGKVLESLYNEDVERVRNGERAQYFGVLNDKPLKNVYPEFDLISKPANMVYKGADMIANPISKVASSGASGFLEKELAGPVYWTKKLGDFMKALYLGATRPIFNSLPESAKPLARQVFKHLYQWRHFTLPDTVRLSRELFGGEDEPESFDAAFKAAREQGLDTFEWNGNKYTTDVKEEGGETNAAEFSLPEVNIYPNNRFGDIARSQGYETAVNWQKVREGVTKGLNDFANDPRTQAVLSILPLPGGIEGVEAASPLIRGAIGKAGNKLRSMVAGMVLKTANPTEKEITDALADRYFRDVFTNRVNRYFTPQEKATVVDVNIDGDKPVLVEKEAELPSFIKDENLVDTTDGVYSYKNPDAKNGIVKNGKNIKVSQVYSSIDGRGDVWLNVDGEKYKIGKMNFEKGDSFLTHVDNNTTGRNFPNKAHFDENGILVPGESKEMNESYIWWERNRPFYNSPSPRMIKVKEDGMDLINARGATGFGSDQSVLSGNVDLKSKDYKILERDPVTGWFDEVKLKKEGGEVRIPQAQPQPAARDTTSVGHPDKSEDDILALVLSSNANFVNRLKQEGRSTIPDWKVEGNIATHKLSAEIGEDGRVYVYPNVQEIDGKLKDFTDPNYGYSDEGRWDAMDSAIKHNDYVVFPDIESAVWFTENYKNKGWFPEFLDGGLSRLAPRDNTSVGHPGKSEDINRNLGVHKDPIDFTELAASFVPVVGDVMDVQDFIRAREEGDNVGMLLASLGFLPIVGGIASAANKARRVARLTSHLQGEDAVKMFKEYGRTDIPENSELAKQLKLYLPDIRNRYGLVGNDDISDDDIIGSIYKHIVELSGDSKNLNDMGEPQILFRGDTKRYDELMDRITPEDLVEGTGTMDNSLGNLFLDRIPEEGSREGIDRYLNTVNADKWGSIELSPSATGSGIVSNKGNVYKDPQRVKKLPSDVVFLYKRGDGTDIYRMPVKFSNDGANDINGFIVRTGDVRDATREIAIDDNYALTSGAFDLHAKRPTTDEEGFIVDESTMRAFDNIEDEKAYVRRKMAEHYSNLLKDAEANNQGLLRSGYFVDERGRRFNPFRGEHTDYNYYALPNFNKQNAKHVLPYDLRVPTDWSDANIYRKEGGPSDLAPRDNTSVGHPGSAKVPPVMPSDVARDNPVISTIASFTPIIGEMLDIRDLYTSLKNNDKTGVLLALTGLIPVIGGVAGNVIKKNNPFWRKKIFSPEELAKDEELISKFPDYAHPNSPMGASVLNHEERLANGAFRKFRNIPAARVGVDSETGNIIYDFNGLDFNFIDVSNSDELKKVAEFYGTTPEEFISGLNKAPFFNYLDHVFIDRKLLEDMADTEELQFHFRDGVPPGSPQEEVLRSHEINHLVNSESKRESAEENGFSFDWLENNEEIGPGYDEYFRVNNNTEIAARGSQIKDYFGLTSPEQKITPEMLEYAARHYIFDYGVNNDMDLFFRSIKDYDKAAKWINKYATAGLGAYWLFDRTSSSDDDFLNGGPIKFARRLNGDSIFERNMISPWKTLIDKPEKKFPKRNIKMPDGGSYNLAPRDNTSVGRPGPADVQPVKPGAAARENPVVPFVASLMPGIGDVMDAHDFIEAARNKNMVGMALAAAGFIPLVGDAFQEAVRFARGRRNSYIRYDAPPRRNDITEGDEELLEKMPDYARPGYPAIEALNVHRRRLSDGAYEQRTGVTGEEAKRELEGFAETFPGIYDRIFDLDYINENDIDVARRVIELIDKRPKGSANTMSEEGVVKRLNEIKQSIVRSSPAFTEGTKGNSGIITLDNWSDFFMDEAYRSGISHELDHAVYLNTPEETIKELSGKVDDWFDSSRIEDKGVRDYVSKPMELLARGTQIKDFYGLTDNAEKVTPEMLKFAARHYADNVMDNQMTEFFNGIKDWDKAAEWISKYSTATLPAIAVSKLLQDGKEKDEYPANKRHGGPMSEDGSVGGDYILDDGGRSLYRRSEYIKNRLLSKYNLLPEESDSIISNLIGKSSLDEKFYDPRHKSYGIGQWSGKDLKEFVLTYKDGGLVDQIDFLAKKYWDGFGKGGKGDIEPGVFDEHSWVVKRIGNEEFYTNSPLLKTLPSMSREDVALSLLPPELWPGILKRKEDVTGKSARRHFIRGGEVSELQDYIYDRLTKEHGIAPIQAIGIVANLTQESALDYDALGDNGRSYGIQQWQGDRRKNLFEFAKKRGRDKPALDDQVDFLVEEYKGDGFLFPTRGENMYKTGKTDKDMFDYFQYSKLDFDNAANIYDSTRAWAQGFGRGNKNFLNMDRRFHIAKTLSSRYNIDAGGQSFYTDMGYKDEWGSPIPEVAVSAEKKAAQDDWMEKYGNKMLASILAGDGEGGDTHVTNNYYVNEEGLSEDEKRNAAEVQELQQKQQAQELLASIIDGIKLDVNYP